MCDLTLEPQFLPGSSFSLAALANIFTCAFEGYFYPSAMTAEELSRRVRVENLDLQRSLVMLIGQEPAGLAVLGLRGARAWCGGFGVYQIFRGRGLASPLARALVDQARHAGARSLALEVLARNERAFKTYARVGFQTRRDLLVLEWRQPVEGGAPGTRPAVVPAVTPAEPEQLLAHFAALHSVAPAWQRDLPSLLVRAELEGLVLLEQNEPAAYVLFHHASDGTVRVVDLAARLVEHAGALLQALQARSSRIVCVNEPEDSPYIPVFLSAGFREIDRQHEMAIIL